MYKYNNDNYGNNNNNNISNNVFIYDIINNEWKLGAKLNYPRWIPYCIINNYNSNNNTYLYVMGGRKDINRKNIIR